MQHLPTIFVILILFLLVIADRKQRNKNKNNILSKDDVLRNWKKNNYKNYPKRFHNL